MSADSPLEVINQNYTEPAPDREIKELIWASDQLINKYGTASRAAEETKIGPQSLNKWSRLNRLPDDILGYVCMGEISPSSADIIRRIQSTQDQRLVSIITVQEDLPQKYVRLLQKEISEGEKSTEAAIESIVGETATLRSVTLGFDPQTYHELWAEAGRRQCSVAKLCEQLIHERITQITTVEQSLLDETDRIQEINEEATQSAEDLIKRIDELDQSLRDLREIITNERV